MPDGFATHPEGMAEVADAISIQPVASEKKAVFKAARDPFQVLLLLSRTEESSDQVSRAGEDMTTPGPECSDPDLVLQVVRAVPALTTAEAQVPDILLSLARG